MYEHRIQQLRARLETEKLDALLVTSLPNIFYLSGFDGSTAKIIITAEHNWFLTDFRYHERFHQQCWNGLELVDSSAKKFFPEIIPGLADASALRRLGFESEHVAFETFRGWDGADERELVPVKGWVEELRMVKVPEEIERLREATRLGERIMQELWEVIGPDTTEADLAAEIHYRALKYGASGYSFDPIIASGKNSAKPHAGFTPEKLVPGTPLTIDMGVKLNGYCSDMTRTVFYKDCLPKWEKIYGIVREAKDLAFDAYRPGKLGKEVDAVARRHIADNGYGECFGHGLGHGIGIEVHESPNAGSLSEIPLKEGNVLSDEPGIYLAGEGGIRIEDLVVVRPDMPENLNVLDTGLRIVG